jgi:phosphoglycerate dehydrogenase-like enzyme
VNNVGIGMGDTRLRGQGWACRDQVFGRDLGTELSGKTVAIVGFGFIGRRVAAICATAFGNHVLAFDPFLEDGARSRRPRSSAGGAWASFSPRPIS